MSAHLLLHASRPTLLSALGCLGFELLEDQTIRQSDNCVGCQALADCYNLHLAVIGRFQLRQIERSNSSCLRTPITTTSSVVTLVRQNTKKCLLQLWSLLGLALASVQPYTVDLKAVRVLWFSTTKAGLICSCVFGSSQVPKTFFERQNSKVGSCLGSS